jgi:hypothetical protein
LVVEFDFDGEDFSPALWHLKELCMFLAVLGFEFGAWQLLGRVLLLKPLPLPAPGPKLYILIIA